jgi:hypothetical protein
MTQPIYCPGVVCRATNKIQCQTENFFYQWFDVVGESGVFDPLPSMRFFVDKYLARYHTFLTEEKEARNHI